MHVTAELCVIPIGAEGSVAPYIAACQPILEAAGLEPQLHAFGTNVEGEWSTVFDAFERCHARIHELGAERVFTTVKLGTRTDRSQSNADKVQRVRDIQSG